MMARWRHTFLGATLPNLALTSLSLASLGLAGLWVNRQVVDGPLSSRSATSIVAQHHPVAALAWALLNCNTGLALKSGTPRIQMEDLLRISAAFDAEQKRRTRDVVCREAIAAADPVLAAAGSHGAEPRAPNIWRALVALAN